MIKSTMMKVTMTMMIRLHLGQSNKDPAEDLVLTSGSLLQKNIVASRMNIYVSEKTVSGQEQNTTVDKNEMALFVIARRVIFRNCN